MKLIDLCQPLFQYACLLNRSARRNGSSDLNQVQSEVNALFVEMSTRARSDPALRTRYAKVEPVLMIFIDEMIHKSKLTFAANWPSLAAARKIADGDEVFFDMMDAALRDASSGALDELNVYYTCLGLGFTGWYAGQAEHLRKRMLELSARLRGVSDPDHVSRIIPEAYEHVDTSNLIESPGASVAGILIGLAGVTIVLLVANFYLYQSSFHKLDSALDTLAKGGAVQIPGGASPAENKLTEGKGGGN